MNGYELRELSDVALVDAYREGNADAFGVLFERYKDKMWAVALRTTRDQELAADAVQEGFIAAFRRIDSFRGDAQFSTWLHRIIVNSSLDRLRRLKPTQEWPEYDIADKRDEHAQTDVRLDVREALDKLPQGQRVARDGGPVRRRGRPTTRHRRRHRQVPLRPWAHRFGRAPQGHLNAPRRLLTQRSEKFSNRDGTEATSLASETMKRTYAQQKGGPR